MGDGVRDAMMLHGMSVKVKTKSFEGGFCGSNVMLKIGQCSKLCQVSYQNLCGQLGQEQQSAIVGEVEVRRSS